MPPKESKKPKGEVKKEVPATPEKQKAKPAAKSSAKTPVKSENDTPKKTPRKPVATSFSRLAVDGSPTAVTVEVEGENGQAVQRKANNFGQLLKLSASETFTVMKTITFTTGELEGYQAILIRPPKAFAFAKLPDEVRTRIYYFYFASKGLVNSDIVLDGKRSSNKEVYAKTYAENLTSRVGLLAINKEFGEEARKVFYGHTIRFDSTATLIDFLSQVPKSAIVRLSSIAIKNYNKTSARNAMHFLSEAINIQKLRFDQGVIANEQDPAKAAKAIHGDMYKFLEAVGTAKGDKAAGVDVLSFRKGALTFKDKKGEARDWTEEMVEEFKENLRAKLK